MSEQQFDKIALIGIGLIGSSIARAVKEKGLAGAVAIATRSADTLKRARELEGDVAVGHEDVGRDEEPGAEPLEVRMAVDLDAAHSRDGLADGGAVVLEHLPVVREFVGEVAVLDQQRGNRVFLLRSALQLAECRRKLPPHRRIRIGRSLEHSCDNRAALISEPSFGNPERRHAHIP